MTMSHFDILTNGAVGNVSLKILKKKSQRESQVTSRLESIRNVFLFHFCFNVRFI